MEDSTSADELREDTLQLKKDLEKIIENMEDMSVQLTWMAYDMVVLRTCPELRESLKKLEDEYLKCKSVICSPAAKTNLEELSATMDYGGTETKTDYVVQKNDF
ncbi:synaptonemal complex central element protein 3 [Chanos chanos]|uniref:Synaptonemal complex central element protein 3 n=1 Tax=Chanos chanos TaxID=29144 RepID=A0A6J2UMT9_CHACN|nr:synaptonemal complex central element protein 3 [Chanos chanos]